ncbi:uncharacterized protein LOC110773213 [Prunus avium]|uniref:Uncharacterized protein LOC110773213 n=1 Tax=Prunus avium TaxID=42229 RepID=A0A6P5U045_PRUAV|nr:uncharacterized protein LOC110773213 [Prunus avium]
MEEVLERQEREIRERRRRRAASKRAQRDLDQQLVMAVALLDEENQSSRGSHEGRAANVDRHRHSRGKNLMEDYFIPTSLYSDRNCAGVLGLLPEQKFTAIVRMLAYGASADQVWHAFFGVAGSQNDLNVLGQSPVFNDVLRGEALQITYAINNTVYQTGYYLANGIYPRWTTFVKSLRHPRTQKQKLFATYQESYRKDVKRCFGILQARWAIIRGAARMFDEEVLRSIMMTCIILHNMIVEDEYDYEAEELYEPDPMNTVLTRIYEKLIGPNGEPLEHEPLVRDGRFMNRMIDRYTEM